MNSDKKKIFEKFFWGIKNLPQIVVGVYIMVIGESDDPLKRKIIQGKEWKYQTRNYEYYVKY